MNVLYTCIYIYGPLARRFGAKGCGFGACGGSRSAEYMRVFSRLDTLSWIEELLLAVNRPQMFKVTQILASDTGRYPAQVLGLV